MPTRLGGPGRSPAANGRAARAVGFVLVLSAYLSGHGSMINDNALSWQATRPTLLAMLRRSGCSCRQTCLVTTQVVPVCGCDFICVIPGLDEVMLPILIVDITIGCRVCLSRWRFPYRYRETPKCLRTVGI